MFWILKSTPSYRKKERKFLLFCLRMHRLLCKFADARADRINSYFDIKIRPKLIFYQVWLRRYPDTFLWIFLLDLVAIYFFFFGRKVGLTIEYYWVLKTLRGPWGHEDLVDLWCPFF